MTDPVLFLDIDGVLNSHAWYVERQELCEFHERGRGPGDSLRSRDYREIDPATLPRLDTIIERSGCKVVISSTWRLLHPVDDIKHLLEAIGLEHVGAIIGKTPDLVRME